MREIISGIDLPPIARPMMWRVQDSIRHQVPHHRVSRLQILLHPQNSFARLIHAILHLLKLIQRLRHRSRAMHTGFTRPTLLPSPIRKDLLARTMAHIRPVPPHKLHSQLIQLLEMIARIRNLPRLVAQPPHRLQNTLKEPALLRFGIRIVESQITPSPMVRRIPKVDKDGFGVADVQVPVWFGGETGVHEATGSCQVLLAEVRADLRVLTGLM